MGRRKARPLLTPSPSQIACCGVALGAAQSGEGIELQPAIESDRGAGRHLECHFHLRRKQARAPQHRVRICSGWAPEFGLSATPRPRGRFSRVAQGCGALHAVQSCGQGHRLAWGRRGKQVLGMGRTVLHRDAAFVPAGRRSSRDPPDQRSILLEPAPHRCPCLALLYIDFGADCVPGFISGCLILFYPLYLLLINRMMPTCCLPVVGR